MSSDQYLDAAGAILDGRSVDWAALPEPQTDADRNFLEQLRVIAELAAAQASSDDRTSDRWGALQIVEKIGSGTFGDVYRAHDPALERDVALKILKHHTAATTAEGRLLARVRHPNVVTVHGAAEHGGEYGIWMELVEGQTLAELLAQHGPFAPEDVAAIGIDLCRALGAVHANGLLHGDIKAQNVMREPDGRIVLMDFGTGRLAGESDGVRPVRGTPLYTPPEVLEGRPLDPRGDIYSLGVLLYHLLTSAFPAGGQTLGDIREVHASGAVTPIGLRRPDTPRKLAAIIDKATAKDPMARFRTPADLEGALSDAATPRARASPVRRRWAFVAGLLAIVGIGFGVKWRTAVERAPAWIVVSAFENHTGDPRLDDVLQFAFEQELAQSPGLSVASPERIADTLKLMKRPVPTRVDAELAREICLRDGEIDLVAGGRVDSIGSRYAVTVWVTSVRSGRAVIRAGKEAADIDGILGIVKQLAVETRRGIDSDGTRAAVNARLERATTDSLEALRAYSRGVGFVNDRNWPAAELELREAISRDRSFASAHIMLAHAIQNQNRPQEDYLPFARRAFELAAGLPDRERFFVQGSYYTMVGDNGRGAAAYEALVREYPNDFWGVNNLLTAYTRTGRWSQAVPLMLRLASSRPNDLIANAIGGEAMIMQGDLQGARRFIERAAVLDDHSPRRASAMTAAWVKVFPVFELWADGRVAEAAARLDAITDSEEMTSALGESAGLMNLALGRLAKAERDFKAMAVADQPSVYLALTALARGDTRAAKQELLADPRLHDILHDPPRVPSPFDVWLLRRLGMLAEAEAIEKASALPGDTRLQVLATRAEVLAGTKQVADAVALLERVQDLAIPSAPVPLRSLDSLAELLVGQNDLETAAARLARTDRLQRTLHVRGSGTTGYYWLRARVWRLRVEQALGHVDRARTLRQELRRLLQVADPDFELLRYLDES